MSEVENQENIPYYEEFVKRVKTGASESCMENGMSVIYDSFVKFPTEKAVAIKPKNECPFIYAVIGVSAPNRNYYMIRKVAEVNVFEYVLSGKGEVFVDGKWQEVEAGDSYVLFAGRPHRYKSSANDPYEKVWINYVADYLPAMFESYKVKEGVYKNVDLRPQFEQLKKSILHEYGKDCYEIAECVNKIVEKLSQASDVNMKLEHNVIREVINNSVYKKVDLDDIAADLHVSKSNVIRVFKKQFGVTPYEYLLGRKIEAAKHLLKNTNMSIREVSEKICMSDEHYFSTLFLKRVGMRPREYRKIEREKQ